MSSTDTARTEALRNVVTLTGDLSKAIAALEKHPFDSDEELVTLTRADVVRVLVAYRDGVMSLELVQSWAETLEGRDDLGLQDDTLTGVLFELSTPEITEPLTPDRANQQIQRLQAA